MRESAEALLARWREAERRHARSPAGTPEWEQSRRDVVEERRRYQDAIDEITSSDMRDEAPIGQPAS